MGVLFYAITFAVSIFRGSVSAPISTKFIDFGVLLDAFTLVVSIFCG